MGDDPTADRVDVMGRISHYALLSGLCQFIPIPFVDDAVEVRVRRKMVTLLLADRGRSFDVAEVKSLYAGPVRTLLGRTGSMAKGLILKPIKKLLRTVLIVFTVRRALLEATEVLLLGHTLDRLLAAGWFADSATPQQRRDEAARVGKAVAMAMKSPERRSLTHVVRSSGRLLRDRTANNVEAPSALAITHADNGDAVEEALSPQQRWRLSRAARDLKKKLTADSGRALLSQFDAQIDAALKP